MHTTVYVEIFACEKFRQWLVLCIARKRSPILISPIAHVTLPEVVNFSLRENSAEKISPVTCIGEISAWRKFPCIRYIIYMYIGHNSYAASEGLPNCLTFITTIVPVNCL